MDDVACLQKSILVLEIFHFTVSDFCVRCHNSHFLKGNEVQMVSQLQYQNRVENLLSVTEEIVNVVASTFPG